MCGFVGYMNQPGIDPTVIKKMADRIVHRGPDDEGFYQDDVISMGFRRLSIIDLNHGQQPMTNQTNTKVLTFNGEIYNYVELREELQELGYEFKTEVDSEVLIHGYDAWQEGLLDRIRGMYAFVIYDSENGEVFGARDHFGIKPLYYFKNEDTFMWGSEIKAFLDHPSFVKELNEELLPIHLSFEYIPSDETLFKNVYKVNPGHYFKFKNNDLEVNEYYHFTFEEEQKMTMDEAKRDIIDTVDESVKKHMIADVEVGSFLSSGIDSSYILNEASQDRDIQSFSLGFDDKNISELEWAQEFAKEIDQKNTAIMINDEDFFGIIPKAMYHMDEPLSNPSAIQLYFLSKETSKHVKVALSGEGADEFFGGYNTYLEAGTFKKYEKFTTRNMRQLFAQTAKRLPHFHGRRFLIRGAQDISERYYRVNYVFNEAERNDLLKDTRFNKSSSLYVKDLFDEAKSKDDVTKMQHFDIHGWLAYDILHKADRMSMANSLEVRTPLVDKEVAEIAKRMPTDTRVDMKNGVTKIAWREASEAKLPDRIVNREKLGFPSPLASWLKEDKYQEMLKDAFNSDIAKEFFNVDYLNRLLEEQKQGIANMQKIFTIYTFIVWYRVYFIEN
ncbi:MULTISPECIES: asparagine synthase (glutamine-hydrolyzing) [Enterococcaceae]|uniref:asparagine synthase (glutamine-hydrolyzing) n=1 Tax=Enterococcaceae TaxID=81852 RepID=UPI000E4CD328|nr:MULTISPECIES: asparagine synthase (glutamine-hydrolyzing) [Enterococcaceae]MCI0130180.1 asparagine synthase (glutamine-hydrolyzing) [Vagococcus sp. CY53-2]RGI31041.1 asparagine synthase (glutamine-hydrolyzing) [Melissococcus sp. OM08-11BH]UNM89003.1 asparagine synthase (glutamine-hydrolyzing) [Vagococcus sp. CY52-2]